MQQDQPLFNLAEESLLQSLQKKLGGDLNKGVATLLSPEPLPTTNNVIKPVMMPDVENHVLDALAQFKNKRQWNDWGLSALREQGPAVLLTGEPGTGKTVIAKWMAKQVNKGFKQLAAADLGGGGGPGDAERAVNEFFSYCRAKGGITIYMDECDHLLMDRSSVTETTWQVSTTETIMMNMSDYNGLILCSTNFEHNLDSAVEQRFLSIIRVPRPDFERRLQLWQMKLPSKFPFRPTVKEMNGLANFDLNGRQIENVIINVAGRAIRKKITPNYNLFKVFCSEEEDKKIVKTKK